MIVEVDGVARRFGDREVVSGVALSIDDAESVALMGPSGCGKTTLLQMIGLLDRPNAGKIVLRGCDAWREPDAIRAEIRLSWLGFVSQQNNLIPHVTARDNVALPACVAPHPAQRVAFAATLRRDGLRIHDLRDLSGMWPSRDDVPMLRAASAWRGREACSVRAVM